MAERNSKGQFVKGVSGNKSGRPKTTKLESTDRDQLVKIVKENVKDQNLLADMLTFLLERANSVDDVFKYFKEFAPFLAPKLSSIKSDIREEKEITIKIEGYQTPQITIDHEENDNHEEEKEV